MQILIDQLNNKIYAYKRQVEETEEVANLNLAKFRKATNELSEVQERSDNVEMQLARTRVRQRSSMSREMAVVGHECGAVMRSASVRRNVWSSSVFDADENDYVIWFLKLE